MVVQHYAHDLRSLKNHGPSLPMSNQTPFAPINAVSNAHMSSSLVSLLIRPVFYTLRSSRTILLCPCQNVKVCLLFLGAVASVLVAPREVGNEVAFLELSVLWCGWAVRVCVDEVLGNHCELSEDRAVPSKVVSDYLRT